jgi:hypothetical protein
VAIVEQEEARAEEPSPAEPVGDPERYGPLRLQRYRKPDGRQLVVYSLASEDERE